MLPTPQKNDYQQHFSLDTHDVFDKKINKIKKQTVGKLVIKEYPPKSINSNHLKFLLDELKIKKGFVPDILVVDYLNLLSSSRVKGGDNSYGEVKSITEELRAVMIERNMMGFTATQTNRSGQTASDYDLTEVGESHGIAMTADWAAGLICTDDMEKMNQMRIKILKNRYGKKDFSFIIGMLRDKMSFYDIDLVSNSTQDRKIN